MIPTDLTDGTGMYSGFPLSLSAFVSALCSVFEGWVIRNASRSSPVCLDHFELRYTLTISTMAKMHSLHND